MLQINVETLVRGRCPALQRGLSISTQLSITICWNTSLREVYLALLTRQYYIWSKANQSPMTAREKETKTRTPSRWTAKQQRSRHNKSYTYSALSSHVMGLVASSVKEWTNFKLNALVLSQLLTTVWDQAHLWTLRRQSRARAQIFPSAPPGSLTHSDITAWPATESCHPPIVGQSPLLRNPTKYSFKAWQENAEEQWWTQRKCLGHSLEECWCSWRREMEIFRCVREQISCTCVGAGTMLR